jgi:hypothetical protein
MAWKLSTKAKIVAGLASETPNCENMSFLDVCRAKGLGKARHHNLIVISTLAVAIGCMVVP